MIQQQPQRMPMTRVDAAWLHMEQPNNLMMITGVLMFDEPVDWDRLRDVIQKRFLDPYPRFSMRPDDPHKMLGKTHWVQDPEFDIDQHLDRITLAPPGDKQALEQLVSNVMSSPLDMTKPLWHLYFIDGYGTGSAVLARLHHALADGIALARVLLSLTDPEPDKEQKTLLPVKSQAGTRALTVKSNGSALVKARAAAGMGARTAQAFNKLMFSSRDNQTVLKGKLQVPKRAAWSCCFSLDAIKRYKDASGYTVNDVLIAGVTGALRKYLIERGTLVDSIRAAVPVNLRPLDGPIKLGNRFGLVFLELPVGLPDARQRLHAIHDAMSEIKHSPEAVVAYGLLAALGLMPPPVERRLMNWFGSKASLVLTNVPGPLRPIYLAGTRLKSLMFWVPQSGGLGLGVSIMSYNGDVMVGITSDVSLIPDPERIVVLLDEEMQEMLALSQST